MPVPIHTSIHSTCIFRNWGWLLNVQFFLIGPVYFKLNTIMYIVKMVERLGVVIQCGLSDLCVLLGLMSLYSYFLLPSFVPSVSVLRFVRSGLCMFVGNHYMGSGILILLYIL